MKKVAVNCLIILIFSILFMGCKNEEAITPNEVKNTIPEKTHSKIYDKEIDDKFISKDISHNYQEYLNKIWIVDGWDGGEYIYPFSFRITQISNEEVEGELTTRSISYPNFYYYHFNSRIDISKFTGVIKEGIVECKFGNDDKMKGKLVLDFSNNNRISTEIEYEKIDTIYKDVELNGKFLFRPYNLSDIYNNIYNKDLTYATDLNSWGHVYIVPGVAVHGNTSTPRLYMVNSNEEILYNFVVGFSTASEIIDVMAEDINGDGLNDIKVTTDFPISPGVVVKEWIFYQMDNGLFYDSGIYSRLESK